MNDKWNPRLRLRNWLMKPSQAESSEQRADQPTATQVPCGESIRQEDRAVGAGFVLLADRHKIMPGKAPEATFNLEVSPSGQVEGISLLAWPPH